MFRIAIVENSESAIVNMEQLLKRYQNDHSVLFQIEYFRDGADLMQDFRPVYDIIFLDVEMPKKDGITTAREIRVIDPEVMLVFVTRMSQYAVDGYTVRAMDFLVKPVSYPAFEHRMTLLLQRLSKRQEKELLISTKVGIRKLLASQLVYVEVIDHRVIYHTEHDNFETNETLKKVEAALTGCPFVRCDNAILVNLQFVTWVGQNELIAGGVKLKISRPRRKAFLEALSAYIGGT